MPSSSTDRVLVTLLLNLQTINYVTCTTNTVISLFPIITGVRFSRGCTFRWHHVLGTLCKQLRGHVCHWRGRHATSLEFRFAKQENSSHRLQYGATEANCQVYRGKVICVEAQFHCESIYLLPPNFIQLVTNVCGWFILCL